MGIKIWNAYGLTGGALLPSGDVSDLDAIATSELADRHRAMVVYLGYKYWYQFDASSTDATDGYFKIRPADYTTAGVWILMPDIVTNLPGTGKNYFINSAFEVNQEGYTSGVITTGEFGHDLMKSISSASYTVTNKALTMVSGTLGHRNDELADLHGESMTVSVVSGSLTLGATGGAAATVITVGFPYTFTLDMDQSTDFITFTDATAALGIKFDAGTSQTLHVDPEPKAEEGRCYYYHFRNMHDSGLHNTILANGYVYLTSAHVGIVTPVTMKSTAVLTILGAASVRLYDGNGVSHTPSGAVTGTFVGPNMVYSNLTVSTSAGVQLPGVLSTGTPNSGVDIDARP